jgi:hypothetical protein
MSRTGDIRFDSWKEIAAYLGHDLRTVARWEKDRNLPVHRVPGRGRRAVYAFRNEIDAWLCAERDRQNGNEWLFDRAPTPDAAVGPLPKFKDATASANLRNASRPKSVKLIFILGLIAIAASSLILFESHSVKGAGVGVVNFSGSQLLVWNNGKLSWSYDFNQPLRNLPPEQAAFKIQIQDWKADGEKEIQVAAPLLVPERGDSSTDALYSFSSRGKLLWHHAFDERIHFGGEDCGPRWEISQLMSTGGGTSSSLWFPICSFPTSVSALMKLDATGQLTRQFVNYGHLRTLNEVSTTSGKYVLAGGINNESDEGALAVLKESESSGRSPQTGRLTECDRCPPGQPYRYFLFPRSEVNRLVGPAYNTVVEILVTGTHIQVMTSEAGAHIPPPDWALYDISSEDFVPHSVSFSDDYWLAHQRLSEQGKISHTVENCPERLKSIIVREWSAEKSWTRIALPPISVNGK